MGAPDDKDAAKPARTEERTTERRLVATTAASIAPESARDATGEDFLFHLYRGSELLQDNRILEAKEELEQALTHQPRDAKGQDLLAVVYFRLGLYPRAIHIYEGLKRDAPRDMSLSVNLSLCYLKTGQAQLARRELEDVVTAQPAHKRAWGYLGLAYERLGDLEKALHAFERGGHPAMVQRLTSKSGAKASLRALAEQSEVRSAAAQAFEELDAGEVTFSIAEPITGSKAASGTWRTVELGQSSRPSAPPPADRWSLPPTPEGGARSEPPPATREPRGVHAPLGLAETIERSRLAPPQEAGLVVHPHGFAIARTGDAPKEHPFAARVDAIRAQSAKLGAEVLSRHQRGKPTGEPFGGLASPLVRISGAGEVVVSPRPGHTLVAFSLKDDTVYTREEALLGFELSLAFENGKLPLVAGDGEATAIVQLRGTGCVLFELVEAMGAVEVAESRPLLARHDAVFAWTSRVTPRAVPIAEAPSGQRGLLSFSGHGFVLLTR